MSGAVQWRVAHVYPPEGSGNFVARRSDNDGETWSSIKVFGTRAAAESFVAAAERDAERLAREALRMRIAKLWIREIEHQPISLIAGDGSKVLALSEMTLRLVEESGWRP